MLLFENLHFWIMTRIKIIPNPRKRKVAFLAFWFVRFCILALLIILVVMGPITFLRKWGLLNYVVDVAIASVIAWRLWMYWRERREKGGRI